MLLIDGGGIVDITGLEIRDFSGEASGFIPLVIGDDLFLQKVVPEASSLVLCGSAAIGFGGLIAARRRTKR